MIKLSLSVRDLVEFVVRAGVIGGSDAAFPTHLEGIRGHQHVQGSRSSEDYVPELSLKHAIVDADVELTLAGRADGLWHKAEGPFIEEIKTTYQPLLLITEQENPHHFAQAKLYAAMYGLENQLEQVGVQVTYLELKSMTTRSFVTTHTMDELKEYLNLIAGVYLGWVRDTIAWREQRNGLIDKMAFPFDEYRIGQEDLVDSVFDTMTEGSVLFAEAPTGIGKTMAVLFGALKALATRPDGPVFFLTTRGTGRQAAFDATSLLSQKGLRLKSLTLTAQHKICPVTDSSCLGNDCPLAKGHADRFGAALKDLWSHEQLNQPTIENVCKEHQVCPYYAGMALIPWVDIVIGDLNYVFNPRVNGRVMTTFGVGEKSYLVDEAHNLVDRARDIFSATMDTRLLGEAKKAAKAPWLKIKIDSLITALTGLSGDLDTQAKKLEGPPENFAYTLGELMTNLSTPEAQKEISEHPPLRELLFAGAYFVHIASTYTGDEYATYVERNGSDIKVKLFCIDPSGRLTATMGKRSPVVFFSATLTPEEYFVGLLSSRKDIDTISLPGPYSPDNLAVFSTKDVSARYKDRQRSAQKVALYIRQVTQAKKGNYLVFFPSYAYLGLIEPMLEESELSGRLVSQSKGMSEADRREFLAQFDQQNEDGLVGLAVLGGLFGESIDLVGNRLSGAVIVTVGLPQICLERDLVRDHFDNPDQNGFDFSYKYPGMVRVLQAAGRVIRTEDDKGVVLLVDDRFTQPAYTSLFPAHWRDVQRVADREDLQGRLALFWST